ncbi:2-phospho-L-lactate transferase [Naumannella halotolerans]|uniref:2-phospho-L-lactate transferase n=1 Tax=Naumannella halotolerans TaxID=993414 RepID=UPI00370D31B8
MAPVPEPSAPRSITVLAGGVGGSRFVRGVRQAWPEASITVIANTADDITLHGLRICPDIDTMLYTLGGGIDPEKGWGRREETWSIAEEFTAYGAEPRWFGLGDRDIATHLVRTQLLGNGYSLSEVTQVLADRWLAELPGVRVLPMTDDRVETQVVITDPDTPAGQRAIHFQEYWVRHHAEPEVRQIVQLGIEDARPGPGVIEAITDSELVLLAPSNPVVSIGPILAVPGIRGAIGTTEAAVLGFSGILGGSPILGMAHKLLPAIGVEVSAAGVGAHYGARSRTGILDGWLVDTADAATVDELRAVGLPTLAHPLLMTDPELTAQFVRAGADFVTRNRPAA